MLYNTLWPSRRCPGLLPDTCPAQLPAAVPKHREMGAALKAGQQMESKNPLKALLPMAISCLFPTSRITNASSPRPRCCSVPSFAEGRAAGNGMEWLTPWREAWGTVGDTARQLQPHPLHQQTLQTPPRLPIFVAICAPDGASPQPPNTSRLSPIQHPTPGTKAQKIPALADVDQPEWSKISSSPACSQGFNSSVRTSVRNCSRSAASPCHVNIQLLLANNSTFVTACGETLQIPTTSVVEKHLPVLELAWNGLSVLPHLSAPSPAHSGRMQLRDAQVI